MVEGRLLVCSAAGEQPRQRAAPRSIACPTTVVPRHSRQPRARLAARGGPGRERAAAQARAHPRSSALRPPQPGRKGVGLLRVAARGRWRRRGESGPRIGHAFACHRANERGIAEQRCPAPRSRVGPTACRSSKHRRPARRCRAAAGLHWQLSPMSCRGWSRFRSGNVMSRPKSPTHTSSNTVAPWRACGRRGREKRRPWLCPALRRWASAKPSSGPWLVRSGSLAGRERVRARRATPWRPLQELSPQPDKPAAPPRFASRSAIATARRRMRHSGSYARTSAGIGESGCGAAGAGRLVLATWPPSLARVPQSARGEPVKLPLGRLCGFLRTPGSVCAQRPRPAATPAHGPTSAAETAWHCG